MIDLYLSKNNHRNQLLLEFFQNYGIEVSCHSISEMTRDKLIEMMSYSSDCFEFLSPNLLRFKNRDNLKLTDFIEMILKNPELTIRLPLAVSNKRVYPNLNLEEARALLPRDTKQLIYMAQTHYLSSLKENQYGRTILGELVHYLAERNISWIELTRKIVCGRVSLSK